MERQKFIEALKNMSVEEADIIIKGAHNILDPLTDQRSKYNCTTAYCLSDIAMLIKEIGKLIASLTRPDKIAIMETAANVAVCAISMEYIYSIDTYTAICNAPRCSDIKLGMIRDLTECQQVLCEDLCGRATRPEIYDTYGRLISIINKLVSSNGLKRAMAVKLKKINEELD